MPHNGTDEEAIVGGLGARLHLGCPEVEVHLVVGTGDGCEVKVTHAAQLQLEGQRRLQVPVDAVLCKLVQRGVRGAIQTDPAPSQLGDSFTSSLALNVKNFGNSL